MYTDKLPILFKKGKKGNSKKTNDIVEKSYTNELTDFIYEK